MFRVHQLKLMNLLQVKVRVVETCAGEHKKSVNPHEIRRGLNKEENTKNMIWIRSCNMLEHNLGKYHTVFAPLLHTSLHLASQINAALASISIFKELQRAVSWFVTCVVNVRVVSNGNINLQDAQKSVYNNKLLFNRRTLTK